MMRGLFKRSVKQPEPLTTEPPVDVLAAIEAATIIARQKAGDDVARAVVMLPGRRGFVLSEDHAEAAIRAAFPDLNQEQVKRAARYLLDRAHVAMRQSAQQADHDGRPRWSDWRPLPSLWPGE